MSFESLQNFYDFIFILKSEYYYLFLYFMKWESASLLESSRLRLEVFWIFQYFYESLPCYRLKEKENFSHIKMISFSFLCSCILLEARKSFNWKLFLFALFSNYFSTFLNTLIKNSLWKLVICDFINDFLYIFQHFVS